MTDLPLFLSALWKHGKLQLTGGLIAVLFLVWSQVNGHIPAKPFWALFVLAFFWAAFNAWREERGKVIDQGDAEQREEQDRLKALAARMIDEYVDMARRRFDSGPSALARLGLHALGSDKLIRKALQEMNDRSGTDPWSGWGDQVKGVDLVRFFALVRQKQYNFLAQVTVQDVARELNAQDKKKDPEPSK